MGFWRINYKSHWKHQTAASYKRDLKQALKNTPNGRVKTTKRFSGSTNVALDNHIKISYYKKAIRINFHPYSQTEICDIFFFV